MLCTMDVQTSCATAAALLLAACGGPRAIDGGFDSANPAARMYAIEYAARSNDLAATRSIVEQLDSDDPGVRFLAIGALQDMWGETADYRYDDPPYLRAEAIKQWVRAVETGELPPRVPVSRQAHDDDG